MSTFGARVKKARNNAGLTVVQLAASMDASPQTVKDWEAGRRTPPAARWGRLADALSVTSAYLVGEDETLPEPVLDGASLVRERADASMQEQFASIVATLARLVETGQEQQTRLLDQQDKLLARLEHAQAQLDRSLDFTAEIAKRDSKIAALERQLGPVSDPGSLAGKKLAR